MAQLLFTKATATSSSNQNEEDTQTQTNTRSLASMAQSMNDGWADDENEEDHNNTDSRHQDEPNWLQPDAQEHISNYGIGAKLLMLMGYQLGKGLGANQDGIVNSIQTKLRPQGLGVGGIKEKVTDQVDYMEVSSEDEKEPKGTNNQRIKLFNLIDELELKGLDVPQKIKRQSDSRVLKYDEMSDLIEKLSYLIEEWDGLSRNEKFIFFKAKDLKAEISKDEEEIKALQRLYDTIAESTRTKKLTYAELTSILESLTAIKSSLSPTTFVNISSEAVADIINELDYHPDSKLSQILTTWSRLYRSIDLSKKPLNAWDSLLWKHIRNHITESHISNINMLKYWITMPIVIDKHSTICIKIIDEIIPLLEDSIPPPSYIVEYLEIVPYHLENLVKFIRKLHSHYLASVTYGASNNLWGTDKLGVAVKQFMVVWSEVFDQFLGQNSVNVLKTTIRNSLCYYVREMHSFKSVCWEDVVTLYNMGFLDANQAVLILQFAVFNPLVLELSNIPMQQPQLASSLVTRLYQWISFRTYGELLDGCFEWYLNVFIKLCDEKTLVVLPTLNHKSLPSMKELIEFMENGAKGLNIDGLPSYQIQTTFRDVVEEVCLENDIVFSSTNDFHRDLGIPLYRLTNKEGRNIMCYIQDDVLWVNKGQYVPISISRLSHEL